MLHLHGGDIPECFTNLIGIRGICPPAGNAIPKTPFSGLYINDLQLITIKNAALLANGEDVSGVGLLERMIELATRKMLEDISMKMLPHFFLETVQDFSYSGKYANCFLPRTNIMRGAAVSRCISDMKSVVIESVDVLVDSYVPVDVCIEEKLIQIIDGIYTTNYYFKPQPGAVSRVEMKYKMKTETAYIVMNNVDVGVNHGKIDKNFLKGCNSCGGLYPNKHNISVKGYNGYGDTNLSASLCTSYSIPPDASFDDCIYGIIPFIRTECDYFRILCAISDKMAWLLMYKTASEFILYWMASDRINEKRIGMPKEELERWYGLYEQEYKNRYQAFTNSIQTLLCRYAGDCIKIKGNQYRYSL